MRKNNYQVSLKNQKVKGKESSFIEDYAMIFFIAITAVYFAGHLVLYLIK